MAPLSKIGFLSVIITIISILSSCNKENDVIPDVYVNFNLDLSDPQFVDLNGFGGTVTVNAKTNNWGVNAAGYNGNGIIVHAGADEFFAYDRTCPHDYSIDGSSEKVNIDPSFSIYAICPKCGTKYALSAGGTPASGIGRYPLKNYKTSVNGRYVTVWNN